MTSSVTSVERRYRDAGLVAAIVVTLGWHVASALPTALAGWSSYRPTGFGFYVWVAYGIIGVTTSLLVFRGAGHSRRIALVTVPMLLTGVATVALATPTSSSLDPYSWAFASAGWFALVVLWRRPATELVAFFVLNAVVGGTVVLVSGQSDRVSIARFVMVTYGISVLPLIILYGSRALSALAARMAVAQDAAARTANREVAARAVHDVRRGRAEAVQQMAADALTAIAGSTADLSHRETRQLLRVAVSRLRRLIVETDEVPDPLEHELRACADAAEQRGIEVDLQRPVGAVPPLVVSVRRSLTEPVIQVLAAAQTWARITVVANPDEVMVAIVADADPTDLTGFGRTEAAYDEQRGRTWLQSRWQCTP